MSHERRMYMHPWNHLRSNAVAYIALLLALSGTSYSVTGSLPGKNTVGSADIINGEVKSPDVGTNHIRSADVRNDDLKGGGLVGEDIAGGALAGGDVADGSLGGLQFLKGSLFGEDFSGVTGADIDEGTLAKLPSARVADSAGAGRYGFRLSEDGRYDYLCDPESAAFIECVSVNPLTLATPGRVLVVATVTGHTEFGADTALGACRLVVNGNPYLTSTTNFDEDDTSDNDFTNADYVRDDATLIAVTDVLPVGNNSVVLECNQGSAGAINYLSSRISTMTLSPN